MDRSASAATDRTTRSMRHIHQAATLWFVVCVAFVLVVALRQAGFRWWVIFSLSGHSALVILLLVSVYLFALYRGIDKGVNQSVEHPLTSTDYYRFFYVATPLLGGLAGWLGSVGVVRWIQYAHGVSLGTFVTTFFVWVLLDPTVAMVETLLPEPRAHRHRRLAQQRAMREERQRRRDQLLSQIAAKREAQQAQWQQVLAPAAQELADLLATDEAGYEAAERRAVDIGVDAWRSGGLICMRHLRTMAIEAYTNRNKRPPVDFITYWWDGVGPWRSPLP